MGSRTICTIQQGTSAWLTTALLPGHWNFISQLKLCLQVNLGVAWEQGEVRGKHERKQRQNGGREQLVIHFLSINMLEKFTHNPSAVISRDTLLWHRHHMSHGLVPRLISRAWEPDQSPPAIYSVPIYLISCCKAFSSRILSAVLMYHGIVYLPTYQILRQQYRQRESS